MSARLSKLASFWLGCFLLLIPDLNAQDSIPRKKYTYDVGGNIFKGFIIKHTDNIGHLAISQPTGFEVYINRNTYGNKRWEQDFNYPDYGVSLSYFDFRNEILGKSISAITYLDLYLKRRPKSEAVLKIGTGLVYSNNPFDHEKNNKNSAISTTISYVMQARLGYNFHLNDKFKITPSLTLTHFSNGGIKLPNKGLNIVTANIGFANRINAKRPAYIKNKSPGPGKENLKLNIQLSSGLKGIHNTPKEFYPFIDLSVYVDKKINQKSAFNLGLDAFYNLAYEAEINRDFIDEDLRPDFKRVGLVAGHELFISKVSLLTQLGVYVYKPFETDFPIYQRYGLKYYIKDTFFASFLLKTHYGTADIIELGLGIRM